MHDLYNILRLYDGIEKPLVVLKEKNKNLIDMQSNCMAEVPKRYVNTCNCNVLIDHIYLDALIYIYTCTKHVREDRDALLQRFVDVTKADCEMNLYLVRAK